MPKKLRLVALALILLSFIGWISQAGDSVGVDSLKQSQLESDSPPLTDNIVLSSPQPPTAQEPEGSVDETSESVVVAQTKAPKSPLNRPDVSTPVHQDEGFGPAEAGGLEGRIVVEASRKFNLQVAVIQRASKFKADVVNLGPGGDYRFDGLVPGEYQLTVAHKETADGNSTGLAAETFQVRPGEILQKNVHLVGQDFLVVLRDEKGEAVEDAELFVRPEKRNALGLGVPRTIGPGLVQVTVWGTGEYSMHARSPRAGVAQRIVLVTGADDERFELILDRGVPCSGKLFAPDAWFTGAGTMIVNARYPGKGYARIALNFQDGVAEFDILGFKPGEHMGTVFFEAEPLGGVTFVLPESGDSALRLDISEQP